LQLDEWLMRALQYPTGHSREARDYKDLT